MVFFKSGASSRAFNRGLVLVAMLVALAASFGLPSGRLEALLPSLAGHFMPLAESSGAVAVIAIDSATLDSYGAWPWSRDRLADSLERLQRFTPAAIGVLLPLSAAETPAVLGELREELDTLPAAQRKQAALWLRRLDTDTRLAKALRKIDNVVLAMPARGADSPSGTARELARLRLPVADVDQSWRQALLSALFAAPHQPAVDPDLPLAGFLDAATAGISETYAANRHVSSIRLAFEVGGNYLPGFELALLTAVQPDTAARIVPTVGLRLAQQDITAADLAFYPRPASAVPVYSLQQLMHDDSVAKQLHNRTLLLGVTAPALVPVLTGPGGSQYAPVGWSAQALDSLLSGNAFVMPAWFHAVQRGLILLFALYLMLLPARWHMLRGPLISALLVFLSLNAGALMLIVKSVWLPVIAPALFLSVMQLLLTLGCRRQARLGHIYQQAFDARVALGGHLQSQGQLELALAQYQPCLPAPVALEAVYELGLEYERRRQMNRARKIYDMLEASAAGFRDVTQRVTQLTSLVDRFPGGAGVGPNQTLVLDSPVVELPRLGRYRLERELGRGAMGTVYLAEDPTIGRQVAIKTLPLQDFYADGEQEQVAQRFLQEAEAAGRLAHPNIVSIHDAGREHDFAYLTMDYVAGESLDAWVDSSNLLPVWEVLEIAAQVADALDYAHTSKIVHRDIKPGNILYDRDSDIIKITDFGVARIMDSQRTRTGTVLGTPSYMSPEQVAGVKINGQSDLFSLGVTVYQLLTGSLPFQGDSVTALMYSITNRKMPPLRKQRSDLPACVGRMVSRALQKVPGKRFASGAEMAVAIRKCRAQFRGGRRKSA